MFTGRQIANRRTACIVGIFVCLTTTLGQKIPTEKDADDLVAYAARLAIRGDAVQIGSDGLTISGSNLSGNAVRRPSDALARAAEIYAELASQSKDRRLFTKALYLWNRKILKPEFAIPYLRLYSRGAIDSRDSFAIYCHIQLAELYLKWGDTQSADEIYSQYLDFSPSEVLEVYAVASTAQRMLQLKRIPEATELAQRAITACDPGLFSPEPGGDGFSLAVAVLNKIPGAKMPEVAKTADGSTTSKGVGILAKNPRNLLREGELAYRLADYPAAIANWQEYQRTFPNEEESRVVALRIARVYERINQTDKALEAYDLVQASYPEFAEGWMAVTGKAQLLDSSGKPTEAVSYLQASLAKARTAEAASQITLLLADLSLKRSQIDDAVSYYLTLMTKYADQNASRKALPNLLKTAPSARDWKKLAMGIKDWLASTWALGSRSEYKNLSISDASRIRRLVLSFYVRNNDVRAGSRWLAELRRISDDSHQEYINRDEAWLYGQAAIAVAQSTEDLSAKTIQDNMELGIAAWKLVPKTEEGLLGIRAAVSLATNPRAIRRINKDLESQLLAMQKDPDTAEAAYSLLESYYTFTGEKRALEDLKKTSALHK